MQIMIDTKEDSRDEFIAARNLLNSLLEGYTPTAAPIAEVQAVIDSLAESEPTPPVPQLFTLPPGLHDIGEDDTEIEIDDEGNVSALTTSVQLQAPPPPAPVVPVAGPGIPDAVPAPPGPAVDAQLDTRGYPWDGRIHASNRATKIDGSWKNKRGVDANLIVQCEAQNKPGNVVTTIPTIVTSATVPAVVPAITAAPAPPAPPAPLVAGPSAPLVTASAPIDFRGLMQKIQTATAAGKLSTDQVNGALAGVGLKPEEMAQLINNAPLIASVSAAIDACLGS